MQELNYNDDIVVILKRGSLYPLHFSICHIYKG